MLEALEYLQPCVTIRIPGAGNKGFYMMENEADYLIHLLRGINYWDMCATDALIRSRFGVSTNKDGEPLIYDHQQDDFNIKNGFIMATNKNIYKLC